MAGQGRAPKHALVNIDALADICHGVPWPDGLVPAHPQARRLLEALGVTGIPEDNMTVLAAQALTTTRDCVAPLCVAEALPGLNHCRRHAPISDLRAQDGLVAAPPLQTAIPANGGRWTRETLIAAIHTWAAEHGRPPTQKDATGDDTLPSQTTARHHGLTWADLIEAAGFPRPVRGGARSGAGRRKKSGREPMAGETPTPSVSAQDSGVGVPPARVEPVTPAEFPLEPASRPAWFSDRREPLCVTELRFDPDHLEDEAAFLQRRAQALLSIAGGIRGLAETPA